MNAAPSTHNGHREYQKHGDCSRQRALKERHIGAIDGRTREGKAVKAWRADAIARKGGKGCPYHVRMQINLATFDLWRMLCLQSFLIVDANERGSPVNKRRRMLSTVHEQYDLISARFERRCEALELDKIRTPNPLGDLGGLL